MIFWGGMRIYALLRDAALVEAVYLYYPREKTWWNATLCHATVMRSSIVFYTKSKSSLTPPPLKQDEIPFVSEFEDIDNFPERFAIRTKNIDLLRELIARGKKVSWFEPDIYTQANYLGLLNFEHVFIDPYINTHIVYPSGEVVLADEAISKNHLGHWKIKHAKRLGCNFKDIHARINWEKYSFFRWKRGKVSSKGGFICKELAVNLYNVFSITYLICQQSKILHAPNAKKKIVRKE